MSWVTVIVVLPFVILYVIFFPKRTLKEYISCPVSKLANIISREKFGYGIVIRKDTMFGVKCVVLFLTMTSQFIINTFGNGIVDHKDTLLSATGLFLLLTMLYQNNHEQCM